jgi:hypothetical protein
VAQGQACDDTLSEECGAAAVSQGADLCVLYHCTDWCERSGEGGEGLQEGHLC